MSTAHHSRKSPYRRCGMREDEQPTCDGHQEVVLVGADGQEQRVCPAHGAALWLTNPALRFSAKTRTEAIAAVMRQAFGGSR
ncbi:MULTISPECIES: hypothetical protein [Streptomyces]|uniref:Uncharacterized protein n=2 Tax=Streptomyces TaxID=1883 RepID=A0A420V6I5_9ACTN|nr:MULTISPECIES: hypothetical protein [Streptomyces]KNE83501.1 hypothetical protein ADZ36_05385 [Streptomyces fradiae]OFA61987.1 hypothetical protein BEN35_00760 [Streptomyces fradiae]PQM24312.1 hypothetical protein Sfr7A_05910 [Streptomyces xinghaiensis]RKM97280.1 hypothetical protein SFRA_008600 [Streptomyces xinghaiensis]RNC75324.1 hypothetical protein DC095_006000 [Streptomyces xinghaiensis]